MCNASSWYMVCCFNEILNVVKNISKSLEEPLYLERAYACVPI